MQTLMPREVIVFSKVSQTSGRGPGTDSVDHRCFLMQVMSVSRMHSKAGERCVLSYLIGSDNNSYTLLSAHHVSYSNSIMLCWVL